MHIKALIVLKASRYRLFQPTTINRYDSRLAILVVLLIISAACQPTTSVPPSTATPWSVVARELNGNQQKWQNAGITHYRFRLFRGCICPDNEDVLIEVENEQVVSLKYQNGRTMNPDDRAYFEGFGTMDRIFSAVEEGLSRKPLSVGVTYEPTYGFPVDVSIDPSGITDDELYLTISDFEALP